MLGILSDKGSSAFLVPNLHSPVPNWPSKVLSKVLALFCCMNSLGTSSSSTTLWATASKEWVIQPKPKPGRKPKKDLASPSRTENEVDTKGRRTQNRAAQRAFRERKQSQLSELQARIQMYEQGEIERNVALQSIAKRLKEENEKLRKENAELQAKLLQIQQQQELLSAPREIHTLEVTEKKRERDESLSLMPTQPSAQKKPRNGPSLGCSLVPSAAAFPASSPPSMVSSPDSNGTSDTHFSAMSYDIQAEINANAFNHFPSEMSIDTKNSNAFSSFGCGFCDEGSICVCREIAVQHIVNTHPRDDFNEARTHFQQTHDTAPEPTIQSQASSILDNLPAYQPPVALRKRAARAPINSVFPIKIASTSKETLDANCSGDPSNCLACGDDSFGKAFCAAIGISASTACDDCPSKASSTAGGGCCGLSSNGMPCATCPSTKNSIVSPEEVSDYIPTNDAWRKLKAHPNVEFADLSLLAEVVSSRSKCSGPRLVISPAFEEGRTNSTIEHLNDVRKFEGQRRDTSPPPRLVPQEVLLECGRRRVRQVHADGVQEALRMLDAKFM